MKKITFILAFLLCGLIGLQAQKMPNFFYKQGNEIAIDAQRFNVVDNDESPKFTVIGKVLTAKNLEVGTEVDIYSILGAKVYSFTYTGNPVVVNLNKGIYIIRVGKYTQKIML
ncbi:MAG: T9SS type A sorting domain-containing protein [Bacteroidales bacterium]|nr:T9SS type A sorting domain-containing protein [Bacteroidales bacterium]